MNAQVPKLEDAENDLKQLMAGRNPGHGKGSASRRKDSLQARGGHNRARIHLALGAN